MLSFCWLDLSTDEDMWCLSSVERILGEELRHVKDMYDTYECPG